MTFKKVVFGALSVFFGLVTVFGGISLLIMPFIGDEDGMGLLQGFIGLLMWAGLTYWFYRLYKRSSVGSANSQEISDDVEFDIEKDLDWSDAIVCEDEIAYVDGSPIYQFDYFDAKGNFSHRRVKVNSIERKNGQIYINATDIDKHASRTFSVDKIDSLMLEETGEIIDDNQVEAHFSRAFS